MSLAALGLALFTPALHVDGNRLFYGTDPVELKGVCVGDVLLARNRHRDADYQTISQTWKANVVRIGMAPSSWKHDRAAAWADMQDEVAAALAQHMFVIIDWHTIGWPNGYYEHAGPGDDPDLYDSSFPLATSFWQTVADTYKNDGRIVFQLWCEPVSSAKPWKDKPGITWKDLKPFLNRLTKTIRQAGAENVVLATGDEWAYDLVGIRNSLLPDANTAYEWHAYADGQNDPAEWARAIDRLDTVRPLIVTEWGYQPGSSEHFRGTTEGYGIPFLKFMNDHHLQWTAWCWHPTWTPVMIKHDWSTPTVMGQFVKDALEAASDGALRP